MKEIMDLIISNGMAVAIIAYFIYKDNKINTTMITLMVELKECISKFNERLEKGDKNAD